MRFKPEGKGWVTTNKRDRGYMWCELCDRDRFFVPYSREKEIIQVCQSCGNEEDEKD